MNMVEFEEPPASVPDPNDFESEEAGDRPDEESVRVKGERQHRRADDDAGPGPVRGGESEVEPQHVRGQQAQHGTGDDPHAEDRRGLSSGSHTARDAANGLQSGSWFLGREKRAVGVQTA